MMMMFAVYILLAAKKMHLLIKAFPGHFLDTN